ncbi:MAG: glycosyltransferase family 2 protein [Eubacteriales bacterium]|jgi:glycosyltransferase involved in cell wall biosynthesis
MLSVVIITNNEETFIRECLESVSWADEIIVIDAFSTDNTVVIAKEYTSKVILRDWINHAEQKNYGIKTAGNKWILSIDADERVSPELRKEILELLNGTIDKEGYQIPFKNYFRNTLIGHSGHYPDYHLRLFKNNYFFKNVDIHEYVDIPKDKIGYLKNHIIHFTYDSIFDLVKKINIYTSLEYNIKHRKSKTQYIWQYLFLPVKKFIWAFFYKNGFKDGMLGFVISICLSFYIFLELVKTWEVSKYEDV